MADETPITSLALSVGEMKGDMKGIKSILENQDKNSAEFRNSVMELFKGIREDFKDHGEKIQAHHQSLTELRNWKNGAEEKVDDLWDAKNNQKGFIAAITIAGSIIGGSIVAAIEWFRR